MNSGTVKYICLNGAFEKADEPVLRITNHSFSHGDALVENIHASGTVAQFLDMHISRLKQSMQCLQMEVPSYFTNENFSDFITKLLNKNRIFGGASVRLIVYRDSGNGSVFEFQPPGDNRVSFALIAMPLDNDRYSLNTNGYTIDLYTWMPKPVQRISFMKSTSALFYTMADQYRKEKALNECILFNEKGHLVESLRSNLFIFRDDRVYTPSQDEGCIPGVMRKVLLSCMPAAGKKTETESPLRVEDLLAADEVFLTNAVEGIRWVGAFRDKRYYRDLAQYLLMHLNQLAFGEGGA